MRKFSMVKKGGFSLLKKASDDLYDAEFSVQTPHNLDDIWGALVKPEKLAQWLLPISGKLSKGGEYRFGDLAKGQISHCEPKRRLGFSFQRGTSVQIMEILFSEAGKGKARSSKITVKFSGKITDLPNDGWQAYGPAALGIGWEMTADALLAFLDAPRSPRNKDAVLSLSASPEGVAAAKVAFEGWQGAVAQSGADNTAMSARAPSLLEFYNGLHR